MSILGDPFLVATGVIALVFFVGLPAWLLMRLILFFVDRMDRSVPPGVFAFCVWTQRFCLCLIAGCLALIFCGSGLVELGRLSDSASDRLSAFAELGFGCYWLAALVLNFPAFPLRWNLSAFWPVHFLLLGPFIVLLAAGYSEATLFLTIALLCSGAFWYLNLSDRVAITPYEELLEPS